MKLSLRIAGLILTGTLITALIVGYLYESFIPHLTTPNLLLKTFYILLLAVFPTTLILWLFFKRWVINPILILNKIAKIISTGNLGKRVETPAIDEIGELAKSLNTTINNLARGLQNYAFALRDEKIRKEELQKSLQEIEGQKAKIESLLSSIGEGVIAINQNQEIILFNKAASDLLGYSLLEALNKPYTAVLQILQEKTRQPVTDFIKKTLTGERLSELDHLVILTKDRQVTPISYTTSPIIDRSGSILGVVTVIRDITRERELDKLKDEFVSVASHELRTPMTAIKGLISMIMEGDYGTIGNELKDPLTDIATSTERLIQLVNDMLDVSRIEGGRVKLILSKFGIDRVTNEVISLIQPLAKQKGINLVIENMAQDQVQADPDKVKQILNNLVGNALKFTDQGTITLSSKINNHQLLITIKDTGIGIAPEDQAKLFTKFQQISSTNLARPNGTGLGLYISRELARLMGGDLWLNDSMAGQGSSFIFSLPLVESTNQAILV